MIRRHTIEALVGLFMLCGMAAVVFLAIKVSNLNSSTPKHAYYVSAYFDNIGGLQVRAPVRMAGVRIGQVTDIKLDEKTYQAIVTFALDKHTRHIPSDSSVSILTEGILGSQYLGLNAGYDETYLKNGSIIQETHSALILEKLIGQFLFNIGNKNTSENTSNDTATNKEDVDTN